LIRARLSGITLALAVFAIACATLHTALPIFFDSGSPNIDGVGAAQLVVVSLSWLTLILSLVRPSAAGTVALSVMLVLCGFILAPALVVAVMYRTWLIALFAVGGPASIVAAVRVLMEWRRIRGWTTSSS